VPELRQHAAALARQLIGDLGDSNDSGAAAGAPR
jgi:hypothetical protein